MSANPRMKPLERKVLRDTVYESLVDMLMSGTLAPGASLSIDGLASGLAVSPTPVREALVHLERTGLVFREPLRGYRVAPLLDTDQVAQLCDARAIVELGALELAFQNADDLADDLAKALVAHAEVAKAVAGIPPDPAAIGAFRGYATADWEFHHAIFRHSGNTYLLSVSDSLPMHRHRLRQSVTRGVHDAEASVAEHAEVLRAVQDGDLEQARRAMQTHLANVKERSLSETTPDAAG